MSLRTIPSNEIRSVVPLFEWATVRNVVESKSIVSRPEMPWKESKGAPRPSSRTDPWRPFSARYCRNSTWYSAAP